MRADRPTFDQWGLALTDAVKTRSKNNDQVGCVLVDAERLVVSTGYSGPIRGAFDEAILTLQDRELRSAVMVHAEINALLNTDNRARLREGTAYVSSMPCKNCMLHLAAAGIKRVVYGDGRTDMMLDEHQVSMTNQVAHLYSVQLIKGTEL